VNRDAGGGFVVGVDGGGTRVRAVVLDREGRELSRVVGPGAVVTQADPGVAADAVAAVVRQAADEAGTGLPLDALWAGLAGAGHETARAAVREALAARDLARKLEVGTDVEAAFQDAFGEGPGILLLAGTGSVAWGRRVDGDEARAGGWGHLVGDEGSGWALGLGALRAVLRAADGRGPETSLARAVPRALDLSPHAFAEALVPWVAEASKSRVASLAQVVAAEASAGDTVARSLLEGAAEALVEHVDALHRRLPGREQETLVVALAGGLLGEGGVLRNAVASRLGDRGLEVLDRVPDPVRGAGRRALRLAAAEPTGR
jgi:glucosamine kinase